MGFFDFLKKDKKAAAEEAVAEAVEAVEEVVEEVVEAAAPESTGNALMDMIYGGTDAVIGLTEGAVAAAI